MKLCSPELLLFYIPCPDKDTALQLGHQAVELRLAACANVAL